MVSGIIKTKLVVNVDVEVGYDMLAGQAYITHARMSDKNFISVRDVYESMSSGDLSKLDLLAMDSLREDFVAKCEPYAGKHYAEFPAEEIRSVPMHAAAWERTLRSVTGVYCMVPAAAVVKALSGICILLEPVLSRVPTAYVWDLHRGSEEKQKIRKCLSEINQPEIEECSDGSIRLRWAKFA